VWIDTLKSFTVDSEPFTVAQFLRLFYLFILLGKSYKSSTQK